MASEDDGWVRKLSIFEELADAIHEQGFFVTCYSLTLNSKRPLQEYHVRRSLLHLLRKVPNLNVCIRPKKEKEVWFHGMEGEDVDFKVLENVDYQEEYEAMTGHHYDSFNGPLWCARLLPSSPEARCDMPEIKDKFRHQYHFLFGFHHAITDGASSIRICDFFIRLLNDVIAGKPINDLEQLAEHASDQQTSDVIGEVCQELMKNPTELAFYQKMIARNEQDILLLEAYPPPTNVKPKTLNIYHSISEEETSKFLKRCKKEGVAIHSGFCAVVNAAIVQMLVEAGITRNAFTLKHYHAVNSRRYWKRDSPLLFGAHLTKLTLASEVSSELNDFWNQARTFHSDFNTLLNQRGPMKETAATMLSMQGDVNISDLIKCMPTNDCYYGTTNMGNLATTFTGEGEYVQVTDFRRTTSMTGNYCSHVFQTFRGRFVYGLDYEASKLSKETAQLYVETIFEILRNVTDIEES